MFGKQKQKKKEEYKFDAEYMGHKPFPKKRHT
jgi:hypothetical protein